jgi:hypothetical protein
LPGHYKLRGRNRVWFPVLVRVENSMDEDGRVADRPRLCLYVGAERHERPDPADWCSRLWPATEEEFTRLSTVHSAETADPQFNLGSAPSLF